MRFQKPFRGTGNRLIRFVWFIWFVWFLLFGSFPDSTNETNQIDSPGPKHNDGRGGPGTRRIGYRFSFPLSASKARWKRNSSTTASL